MNNRPKIVLFSGDLPSESPGQFTSYTDFNNERKQSKRTEVIEEGINVQSQKARLGNPTKVQKVNAMSRPWIYNGVRNSKPMAIGAFLGLVVGAILVNFGNLKKDGHISANATTWISLIGRLYLRATFCVLIPWVLSSMAMSIAEILRIGKGSRIAVRVVGYFLITKVFAVCTALAVAMAFQSQFKGITWQKDIVEPKMVMRCGTSDSAGFMSVKDDGSVVCVPLGPNMTSVPNSDFIMKDTNNVFLKYTDSSAIPETTFAQAIIQLTNDFVPDNMVRAMVSTNILSVAMFAMLFGAAVCKNYRQNSTGTHYVMDVLRQFTFVCELLVEWLLYLSPIGVFSLLAGAGAYGEDIAAKVFNPQTAYYLLAYCTTVFLYSGIILPAFLYATTKINPYKYLAYIVPAQVFAFSCSSSAACIPLTMRCVESTREVSTTLARYVVTLGAPLNKDGAAIYLIISTIFLVNTSQLQISSGNCVWLMLLSLITSVVTLPIPFSGPVTLYGVWATLQSDPFPVQIGYLVGINWLVDRIATVVNITGDTVVARIIADQVEETCIREDEQATYESAY